MKNNLGKLIKKNRISIEQLSKKTKIGRTTIYQIINSKRIPNVEYALRLSKYFNISVEELFFSE
ncbi:UNVERIFIED_ORG: hypothetical protein B2H93_14010 [Clostridium botulinum]